MRVLTPIISQSVLKLQKVKESSGPKNVTNALFVGSTAELQKMLKKSEAIEGKTTTLKKSKVSDK